MSAAPTSSRSQRWLPALLAVWLWPVVAPRTALAWPVEWLSTLLFGDRLAWQSEGGGWLLAATWGWAGLNVALVVTAWRDRPASRCRTASLLLAAWTAWSLLDPWTRQDGPLPEVDLAIRLALSGLALWLATIPPPEAQGRLLGLLFVAVGWEAAVGVVRYLGGLEEFGTPGFGARASGTLAGPGSFYPIALCGALWGWVLGLRGAAKPVRVAGGCLCLVGGTAVLYTYQRAAWLGLAAGLLAVPRAPRAARVAAVVAAGLLLLALLLVRTGGRLPGGPADPSGQSRIELWRLGLRSATESPVVGAGVGNWYGVTARHATAWSSQRHWMPADPKSLLLSRLVEQGLVGLVLWLLLCWQVWRLGRRPDAPLPTVTAGVLLVGLHAAGLFDTPVLTSTQHGASALLLVSLGCAIGTAAAGERAAAGGPAALDCARPLPPTAPR